VFDQATGGHVHWSIQDSAYPLNEVYGKTALGRIPAGHIQKIGRGIEAGDAGAALGQSVADTAVTTSEIENGRAWRQRNKLPKSRQPPARCVR
jgi:hypothetical protein